MITIILNNEYAAKSLVLAESDKLKTTVCVTIEKTFALWLEEAAAR